MRHTLLLGALVVIAATSAACQGYAEKMERSRGPDIVQVDGADHPAMVFAVRYDPLAEIITDPLTAGYIRGPAMDLVELVAASGAIVRMPAYSSGGMPG